MKLPRTTLVPTRIILANSTPFRGGGRLLHLCKVSSKIAQTLLAATTPPLVVALILQPLSDVIRFNSGPINLNKVWRELKSCFPKIQPNSCPFIWVVNMDSSDVKNLGMDKFSKQICKNVNKQLKECKQTWMMSRYLDHTNLYD